MAPEPLQSFSKGELMTGPAGSHNNSYLSHFLNDLRNWSHSVASNKTGCVEKKF